MLDALKEDGPPEGQYTGLFGGGETGVVALQAVNGVADGSVVGGHPVGPGLLQTREVRDLHLVPELLPGRWTGVEDDTVVGHDPTGAVVGKWKVLLEGL